VAPLTLFRLSHSGRGASRSSAVERLELATFGLGALGVFEVWDFDADRPAVPVLSPQFQLGLLTTVPSQTNLDVPSLSIVAGLGVRTPLGTSDEGDSIESAFKILAWYELMFATGRGHDPSQHLLFGFAIDAFSIGN
jgi:hypothetical protein